jgi:hypothetical protein
MVLQSFPVYASAKKISKGILEKICKDIQKAVSSKDMTLLAYFVELGIYIASFSKAEYLNTIFIVKIKTHLSN